MPNPKIIIRPALHSDLPTLSTIDSLANASHPAFTLGLGAIPRPAFDALHLSRWEHQFKHSPPFHFLVATILDPKLNTELIVGVLSWQSAPAESEKIPEWKPDFPPETNVPFMEFFMGSGKENRERFKMSEYCNLNVLSVAPELQRKGVGMALMERFMEDWRKEGDGKACFIVASAPGRALYERWGWMVVGENAVPLGEWGVEGTHVVFVMKREADQ